MLKRSTEDVMGAWQLATVARRRAGRCGLPGLHDTPSSSENVLCTSSARRFRDCSGVEGEHHGGSSALQLFAGSPRIQTPPATQQHRGR